MSAVATGVTAALTRPRGQVSAPHAELVRDARAAVKAAVMCGDVARTVHVSRLFREPLPIAADDIDRLYDRYRNIYGQR